MDLLWPCGGDRRGGDSGHAILPVLVKCSPPAKPLGGEAEPSTPQPRWARNSPKLSDHLTNPSNPRHSGLPTEALNPTWVEDGGLVEAPTARPVCADGPSYPPSPHKEETATEGEPLPEGKQQ